jgi:hypothetical protein
MGQACFAVSSRARKHYIIAIFTLFYWSSMPFLIRSGRVILLLALFLVLMSVLSKAITHVTAERYAGKGEPNRLFSIVAVPQHPDEAEPGARYLLMRWARLRDLPPARRFQLPEPAGEFALPKVGDFEPLVRFSSSPEADGRTRVAVTVSDDDYVVYSTYITDGTTITPVNFRIWGPTSMLLALIPAVVLTWAFNRMAGWWWRRRKKERLPA